MFFYLKKYKNLLDSCEWKTAREKDLKAGIAYACL